MQNRGKTLKSLRKVAFAWQLNVDKPSSWLVCEPECLIQQQLSGRHVGILLGDKNRDAEFYLSSTVCQQYSCCVFPTHKLLIYQLQFWCVKSARNSLWTDWREIEGTDRKWNDRVGFGGAWARLSPSPFPPIDNTQKMAPRVALWVNWPVGPKFTVFVWVPDGK